MKGQSLNISYYDSRWTQSQAKVISDYIVHIKWGFMKIAVCESFKMT